MQHAWRHKHQRFWLEWPFCLFSILWYPIFSEAGGGLIIWWGDYMACLNGVFCQNMLNRALTNPLNSQKKLFKKTDLPTLLFFTTWNRNHRYFLGLVTQLVFVDNVMMCVPWYNEQQWRHSWNQELRLFHPWHTVASV